MFRNLLAKEKVVVSTKAIIFLIGASILFLFLNSGFVAEPVWVNIQAVFFAFVLTLTIFIKKIPKTIWFFLGLVLLFLMNIFFIFGLIEVANITGSTGFGVLLIFVFSFFKQLLKRGFIKELK